jgi:sporulation protein YlmC with PRC-barrel domain
MKLLNGLAIAAAVVLTSIGCVQTQREATSISVPERTMAAGAEDAGAASLNAKWVSALVGMKVETPSGARLGTVKDVIVDGYGRATYAVVSYGGMLGLGNRYTAVPWVSVAEMLQRDRLLIDQSNLENAPLLASAKPELTNTKWRRDADDYWRGKVAMRSD